VRWARPIAFGLTVGALIFGAFTLWIIATDPAQRPYGFDRDIYVAAANRWLGGGSFYLPHQLAGPYVISTGDVLYPPTALLLFVPATVLPWPLWYLIPVAIVAGVVIYHRPAWWAWPVIAACLCWPLSLSLVKAGNPVQWLAAFVALGTIWKWPAAFVILKPTDAPLALLGVRSRAWWLAGLILVLVSVGLLPMWSDYLRAVFNASGPRANVLYSIGDLPLLLVPVVAWLGGRRAPRLPVRLRARLTPNVIEQAKSSARPPELPL
jgi:hypothetical protein